MVSGSIDHKVPDETISPLIEATSIRGPYFDKTASKNVTALVGHTAYLNCRVRNLGNRTVSYGNSYDIFMTYNYLHSI
jgi:hypothetical protein